MATGVYPSALSIEGYGTSTSSNRIFSNNTFALGLFAELVQDRINSIINNLEQSSEDGIFSTLPFLTNLSESYHGIPGDLDRDKREALDYILKINPDIASIYFVLPNGDIYLGEPYMHQEQLPRLNYADREWYKGVTALNSTYVSSVFLSASINAPAIAIAAPVWSNNNETNSSANNKDVIIGYLVGIVDLKSVKGIIKNIDPNKIGQLFVVDKNGTELVSSVDNYKNGTLKNFDYFERLISNETQLNFSNQTISDDLNSTLIFSKPISFKGGNLIAILTPENK